MSALSFVAEATADVLRQAAREIATPTAQAASDEAVALVFSPATLAARVTAAIAEIPDPDMLATVAESGLTLPAVPVTTANRRIQAANQAALVDLVRGAATVELARRTAAQTWNDRVSAAADRDRVNGLLDAVSARADTSAFAALRAVRAAIEAHRGAAVTGVVLTVGGRLHDGWTSAVVTRSLETIAGTFKLQVSNRNSGESMPRTAAPGDACALSLDGEVVITGHLDAVAVSHSASHHELELSGRDATSDLVDCSAETRPGEWSGETLERIAATLTAPFGIPVRAVADTGAPFRRFRIEEGETVYEAIERGCRMRGLLPLSDGKGGIELGLPVRSFSSARLERGRNILSATGQSSWIDRHSVYRLLGQQPGDDFLAIPATTHVAAAADDPAVNRHRPLTIIGEQALGAAEARDRVNWEASVRAARSRRVTVTVQGWRERPEPGSPLWSPGRLVHVSDDWLGLDRSLLVSSVRQSVSSAGTITALTLLPENAFLPMLEQEPEPAPEEAFWWK